MRIEAIEVYQYDLSYRDAHHVMSGGRVVKSLSSTVVRVIADDGLDGFAETCPLGANYLPAPARCRRRHRQLGTPLRSWRIS